MEALFARAARLVKVDYAAPRAVIGKTTVGGLQSGLVYGFAGQVDGIVGRIREELGAEARAIATGGLADLVAPHSRDDRARRPVPHARGPAPRLGAERVIPDPPASACSSSRRSRCCSSPARLSSTSSRARIQQGRRAGLASVLGIHVGTLVHIAAATLGLSALVVSSAVAFTAVKIAGAVYLDRPRACGRCSRAGPSRRSRSAASGTSGARSRRASS